MPHSLITSVWKLGASCCWIACALWQSVQPGAASMPSWRILPCIPFMYASRCGLWQAPQVSGTFARFVRLPGSLLARMLCAPWQFVHVGAEPCAAPCSALPWMLSWNLLAMLPLGSLPLAIVASSPWQREQVASTLAWFVRDAGSFARRMSCVPWQSVQVAATVLPPLRDLPWTVPLYSLTGCSWQVAQFDRLQLLGVRDLVRGHVGMWQSVHLRLRPPCTDAANFAPSTAIDLPPAPFASAAPWHMRHVSLTLGAGAAAAGLVLPNAAMATKAQKNAPAARTMIEVFIFAVPRGCE